MAAVTDAVGLSAKRFIERFKSEVGLTPKRYCRVLRFQQVLAQAHRGRASTGPAWPPTAATSTRRT